MITHYTAITFLSAFSMLIMIFCVQRNQFTTQERKRQFQLLFFLLIVTNLAEWSAATLADAAPSWRAIRIATKFLELLLTPFVPYVCMGAIGEDKLSTLAILPVGANAALQIISLFNGCVFAIDAANVYTRGSLYLLYTALFLAEVLLLILRCLRFSRQYQFANQTFLLLIFLLVLLAVFMEFYAPYLRLDWVCVGYAAILFFIYYEQLVQQVDALTGLLNRRSFDSAVDDVHAAVTVIFFDVDHFKAVNDAYGHKFGDHCLQAVAQEIRTTFEPFGYCYRYGGDEFCVILRKGSENVDALISGYISRIRLLREREPRIPFVSAGYAHYNSDQETINDAIHRADEMMYHYKELHREDFVL